MHATLVMIVACVCALTTVTTTQVLAMTVCAYAMKGGVVPTALSASASVAVCTGDVTMVYASAKLAGVEATATSKIVLQTATATVFALTAYVPASLTGPDHRATKGYAQVCAVAMVSVSKRMQRAFALTSLLDQHATCVNVQQLLPTPPAVGMGSARVFATQRSSTMASCIIEPPAIIYGMQISCTAASATMVTVARIVP